MKTYSELCDLAKSLIRRIKNNSEQTGAVVMLWNRGTDKTPVAIYTHGNNAERKVVIHLLRSAADQIENVETVEAQGMTISPAGLLIPKA